MKDGSESSWPARLRLGEDPAPALDRLKSHLMQPKGLIALPTETVYGLAANGLCEESVRHIFTVKGRPLTDPVILHVSDFADALRSIFNADLYDACVVLLLAKAFAPGPLTLITRGRETIPAVVSANTGFPAVRCPNHPVAQRILRHAGVPLAAPSANKFGHISPTCADHVISEFQGVPILVVDGGQCTLGLESTVLKLEPASSDTYADEFLSRFGASYEHLRDVIGAMDPDTLSSPSAQDRFIAKCEQVDGMPVGLPLALLRYLAEKSSFPRRITILRPGFVTEADLKRLFKSSVFSTVEVGRRAIYANVDETCEAPGTTLSHYAPSVPTYLVCAAQAAGGAPVDLQRVVMIDAEGVFKGSSQLFLHYISFGQGDEAVARGLYGALREAESVALRHDGQRPQRGTVDGTSGESAIIIVNHEERGTELNATVRDRLVRASSGNTVAYVPGPHSVEFYL
ncbi:threonylcarbamoyl-AMP synthase, putative [Babesia caballi]|uniref:Threonylcarbamoyl-AMP synthase n=1 Tax=Babesia caballi TaxID=5871 RepID=A0AAV4LYN4_BABCB|nr:threonylcarbamoyl-AMP synthase, putative [Babesia caballi]